jgi:hypothetical protein
MPLFDNSHRLVVVTVSLNAQAPGMKDVMYDKSWCLKCMLQDKTFGYSSPRCWILGQPLLYLYRRKGDSVSREVVDRQVVSSLLEQERTRLRATVDCLTKQAGEALEGNLVEAMETKATATRLGASTSSSSSNSTASTPIKFNTPSSKSAAPPTGIVTKKKKEALVSARRVVGGSAVTRAAAVSALASSFAPGPNRLRRA